MLLWPNVPSVRLYCIKREMKKEQHILAISTSGAGHINPLFELCLHLAPFHEFRASLVVNERHHSRLHKRLMKHIQLLLFPPDVHHHDQQEPAGFEELVKTVEPPVTCIISDVFLGWTQDLANRLGIPRVAFGSTNAHFDIFSLNIPQLLEKGFVPIKDDPNDQRFVSIPGIPAHFRRGQLPFAFNKAEPHTYSLGKAYQRLKEAVFMLGNTVEELEVEAIRELRQAGCKYLPVGPLVPGLADGQKGEDLVKDLAGDHGCVQWLDRQQSRSVIYVAFGSQVKLPVQQVEKLATGLLNSKQPFLWAARKDFARNAADGYHEGLEARILSSNQGMLVEWAPQARVLQHGAVAGFLTHCGWNSTMEAVCSGVPTLCWACDAEQNTNSYIMVQVWGTGLRLGDGLDDEVSEEKVESMVRAITVEENALELRQKAFELKEAVGRVWKKGGSSWQNIHLFVDLISSLE